MAYFNEDVQVVKAFFINLAADETGAGPLTDLDTTHKTFFRITTATELDSIAAISDKILTLVNATGAVLTIKNETGTTAANRILTGRNGDLLLPVDGTVTLHYDSTSSRWRCTADNTPPLTQTVFTVAGSGTTHTIDTSIDYARAGLWSLVLNAQTNTTGSLIIQALFGYNNGTFFSQNLNLTGILTAAYSNNSGKVRVTVTTLLGNTTFVVVGSCVGQYS